MSLTLGQLRQYLADRNNDSSDPKAERLYNDWVNQGLAALQDRHEWLHYRTRYRLTLSKAIRGTDLVPTQDSRDLRFIGGSSFLQKYVDENWTLFIPSQGELVFELSEVLSAKRALMKEGHLYTGDTSGINLDDTLEEDFADDTGFTYNAVLTEFSAGQAQQVSQLPAGSPTFGANYSSSVDANWGGGVLTGTPVGGAAVSAGKLDLRDFGKRVDYSATGNANSAQQGCIRFRFTPDYTTKPVGGWNAFFTICNASGTLNNRIEMRHSSSAGQLQFRLNSSTGASLGTYTLANWNPTAGVEYEMEFNWDFTGGTHRLFIDGVLFQSFVRVGTRSTASALLRIGADYNLVDTSDGQYNDVLVFPTVQHTANYTPGYTVPDYPYAADVISLPQMTITPPEVIDCCTMATFSVVDSGDVRYTIQVESGNHLYWDGSSWAASSGTYATASTPAQISANINTLPGIDLQNDLTIRAYTNNQSTQGFVGNVTLSFSTIVGVSYILTRPIYPLPKDVRQIRLVEILDSRLTIEPLTSEQFDMRQSEQPGNLTEYPYAYAIKKQDIHFWPYPDVAQKAIRITYDRLPPRYSSADPDETIVDWDGNMDELLLKAVELQLVRNQGKNATMNYGMCLREFEDAVKRYSSRDLVFTKSLKSGDMRPRMAPSGLRSEPVVYRNPTSQ